MLGKAVYYNCIIVLYLCVCVGIWVHLDASRFVVTRPGQVSARTADFHLLHIELLSNAVSLAAHATTDCCEMRWDLQRHVLPVVLPVGVSFPPST